MGTDKSDQKINVTFKGTCPASKREIIAIKSLKNRIRLFFGPKIILGFLKDDQWSKYWCRIILKTRVDHLISQRGFHLHIIIYLDSI